VHAELATLAADRGFSRLRDAVSHAHREPDAVAEEADDDDPSLPEWV
jgi:hypothetical protein